ncbi:GTP cyclohydrolase I FolE [Blattabacterium cuenoti]|uniref:GTP cyclohydrolase 1 n=1 Tax=Blattabacterium cuenoti BPAA TaxID=1229512 RepID=M4ZS83_9FLAO|nr:GTP cyclohydrolase I FolE [Blattabacterium cuenoti]BAM99371.1 GTP cyclohydrolase I [Blattabacterium cuenoti BPAA]
MMEEKHNKIKKKKLNQKYNSILNHSINSDLTSQNNVYFMSDEEKIEKIKKHFFQIMEILGLDMNDDSLRKTPKRVAKMFIQEIFSGLNPKNTPNFSIFENKYRYNQMLIEKNITVYSTCEHHFLPIIGKAHVGYISNGKVVGLSKINRIVNFYAKRPQVQERLTIQIVQSLKKMLETQDVACIIEAKHLCVNSRGIKDTDSSTVTTELIGSFKNNSEIRKEFLHHIGIS